jgi:hypothetical protein
MVFTRIFEGFLGLVAFICLIAAGYSLTQSPTESRTRSLTASEETSSKSECQVEFFQESGVGTGKFNSFIVDGSLLSDIKNGQKGYHLTRIASGTSKSAEGWVKDEDLAKIRANPRCRTNLSNLRN